MSKPGFLSRALAKVRKAMRYIFPTVPDVIVTPTISMIGGLVPEDTGTLTTVATFVLNDAVSSGWTLDDDGEQDNLALDSVTGVLTRTSTAAFNFDTHPALHIAVSNGDTTSNFTISITDVSDLSPPVLSDKSSGWTTGDNPPSWVSTYPDSILGRDWIRARWRTDEGDWTVEDEQELTSDILIEGEFDWPLLAAATLSGFFEVQEQKIRDFGDPAELTSAWSDTWDDDLL